MAPGTHIHPRPRLRRASWTSLDGTWQFALDHEARWVHPARVVWDRTIRVPFSPETPASGVGDTGLYRACWYRRTFDAPALAPGQRLLLHFGAVDYEATVWVNGAVVAHHAGGYTPFSPDVTDYLAERGPQEVVVRAFDDPRDLSQPRGKQDWQREPHSIWYPRTTGIWQTVWLERVPPTSLHRAVLTGSLERWEIGLTARIAGEPRDDLRLRVRLRAGERILADDSYRLADGAELARGIALPDPGVEDQRRELLWSPTGPTLIEAELELIDGSGTVRDVVSSYTAMRSVRVEGDRFLLNGRPLVLRMALDQGYWPDSGLTAPDDAALRRDVLLARRMGFNGVRKHQKIEDPRFLYWADTLGLLVWEEMPSAYRFTADAVRRVAREWTEVIERDAGHPCIVAWVPLNESWGVPDLSTSAAQRDHVNALYHLTRALDPDRPVSGNDGWEHARTDLLTVHDYAADPAVLARRYGDRGALPETLHSVRPAGRSVSLEGYPYAGQPVLLTEFGGIGYAEDRERTWGYWRAESPQELATAYARLLETIHSLGPLAGFCYTQFADTYQEANGLLYMDRTPKFPLEEMARATRGRLSAREEQAEREWEARVAEAAAG